MSDARLPQDAARLSEDIGDVLSALRRLIAEDEALSLARDRIGAGRADADGRSDQDGSGQPTEPGGGESEHGDAGDESGPATHDCAASKSRLTAVGATPARIAKIIESACKSSRSQVGVCFMGFSLCERCRLDLMPVAVGMLAQRHLRRQLAELGDVSRRRRQHTV